jgi:hypothetical protein
MANSNSNLRRHLKEAELWTVVWRMQQRATFRQVSATLGVHHTVINRACERYRLHGIPARRHAGGRQRVTTPAQDRCFVVQARPARALTATSLLILRGSVFPRRRLSECNLRSRRPCIRIPLTRQHR